MIVRFIARDGTTSTVNAEDGARLLDVAQADGQPLEGTCEGDLACATCHVYVTSEPTRCLPPPGPLEAEMLDFVLAERRPGSRLCCQLVATEGCDGLIVQIAEVQR